MSMFLLYWVAQHRAQISKCITPMLIISLDLLLYAVQEAVAFPARACCWLMVSLVPPQPSGISLQSCFLSGYSQACVSTWDYSFPGAEPYTSLFWNAWGSCVLVSPDLEIPLNGSITINIMSFTKMLNNIRHHVKINTIWSPSTYHIIREDYHVDQVWFPPCKCIWLHLITVLSLTGFLVVVSNTICSTTSPEIKLRLTSLSFLGSYLPPWRSKWNFLFPSSGTSPSLHDLSKTIGNSPAMILASSFCTCGLSYPIDSGLSNLFGLIAETSWVKCWGE